MIKKAFCKCMLICLGIAALLLFIYRKRFFENISSWEIMDPAWLLETARITGQVVVSTLLTTLDHCAMGTIFHMSMLLRELNMVSAVQEYSAARCYPVLRTWESLMTETNLERNLTLDDAWKLIPTFMMSIFNNNAYLEKHRFSSFLYPFKNSSSSDVPVMTPCSQGPMYFQAGFESIYSWLHCSLDNHCAIRSVHWIQTWLMDATVLKESMQNHSAVLRGDDCELIVANHVCTIMALQAYPVALLSWLMTMTTVFVLPFTEILIWLLRGAYPEMTGHLDRLIALNNHLHAE